MKFVVQRVNSASVTIDGKLYSSIGQGLLVLVGVGASDTREIADRYLNKLLHLRIFADENGKTNLSLEDVGGQLMLVSQFTLYANCRKGKAEELYLYLAQEAKKRVPVVKTGVFGADMKVNLENDGPFTILMDERLFEDK